MGIVPVRRARAVPGRRPEQPFGKEIEGSSAVCSARLDDTPGTVLGVN